MTRSRSNPDFLNGVPEMVILQLLERRPMYGYELVEAIRASTDHVLTFGEGCIYPLLHRLEAAGHLASRRELVGGRSRVVYRVTEAGKRRLAETVSQWRRITRGVSRVVGGEAGEANGFS